MQCSGFLKNWDQIADDSRLAVRDETGESSFKEVTFRAKRICERLLQGRKSLSGIRIGILVEPGVSFVSSFLGVLSAGGTAVVLSPLHPSSESAYFCKDAGVETVLASKAWKSRVTEFAPQLPILIVDGMNENRSESFPHTLVSEIATPFIEEKAPALQLYTSGTTGKPKGAVLSHENLSAQQTLLKDAWGLQSSDILLHTLPLHHMHGLCIALWSVLGAGGCVSFLYPFDAARVWNAMRDATVFMAVPTIYSKIITCWENASPQLQESWRTSAKNLRLATSGSAALPVTLAEKWKTFTGKYPLERFGMTEVGVALSNPLSGERKPGRVGLPLPSVHYKIMNELGEASEEGELWIAGPSVFSEYFERPESTQAVFEEREGIQFFKTGDTVRRDEDGYFQILGRNSVDILKSGGYKLSAIEIEEVFREHPAIAEVAVVGLPDEVWGDRVIACIVLKKDLDIESSEDTLRAFAKSRLASYKVPKQIVFYDKLPANALGKVLKKDLIKNLLSDSI
jgi:malonyl-CoA/methylmalonyl-CoA synthetase